MPADTSLTDLASGYPMTGSILGVLFGGMLAMGLVMLAVRSFWKAMLVALALGAMAIPMLLGELPFWPAFYAPWVLGALLGIAVGAVAREERLTALLLFVSAALASPLPLWPYKSVVNWQPPWTAEDVFLITVVELFNLGIFTWLVAALLLLVLAALIAGPLNLVALLGSPTRSSGEPPLRESVNAWFKDRFQIVFGILGIVSEVGSSRAELELARLKAGALSSGSKYRR